MKSLTNLSGYLLYKIKLLDKILDIREIICPHSKYKCLLFQFNTLTPVIKQKQTCFLHCSLHFVSQDLTIIFMSSKHLKTLLFLVSLFLLSTTIGGVMVNLLTMSVLVRRLESDQPNLLTLSVLGRRLESDQPNLLTLSVLGRRLDQPNDL